MGQATLHEQARPAAERARSEPARSGPDIASGSIAEGAIVRLQRAVGNAALIDLLRPPAEGSTGGVNRGPPASGSVLQAKSASGPPPAADPHEAEANRVADGSGDLAHARSCGCGGVCPRCQAAKRLLQRQALDNLPTGSIPPNVRDILRSSGSATLPQSVRAPLEARLGHDLGAVRVHTDGRAAASAQEVNALAYTVGSDIVFGAGQYAPGTVAGDRLIAHEATHVVQQSGAYAGPRPSGMQMQPAPKEQPARRVSRVIVCCPDNVVVFETPGRNFTYKLSTCKVTDGIYKADVTVEGNEVNFELEGEGSAKTKVDFGFSIGPGQENPTTLFREQSSVAVVATNKPLSRLGEVDIFTPLEPTPQGGTLQGEYEAFKRLVRNAGKARMANNRAALAQWKTFIQQRLSPTQLRDQVLAQQQRDLIVKAQEKGNLHIVDLYARTKSPFMREYQAGVATGEKCPSCHAIQRAETAERETPAWEKTGPRWQTPITQIEDAARREAELPSARPEFLSQKEQEASTLPADKPINAGMYPNVAQVAASVEAIRPFLVQLGPTGYRILPAGLAESNKSAEQLLTEVTKLIDQRRADYLLFSQKIDEPDFDYLLLRPIVRDLLPLASDYAQYRVEEDIRIAERDSIIESIIVGIATIGALLLTVFPPTTALGVAALTTLEVGLGTYAVVKGADAIKQGQLLRLGAGANNVLDPEQQDAADSMIAMGYLSVVLGGIGLGAGVARGVRLIRSATPPPGGGTTPFDALEAEAGGNRISITGMKTADPRYRVTAPDGTVIREGSLLDESLTTATTPPKSNVIPISEGKPLPGPSPLDKIKPGERPVSSIADARAKRLAAGGPEPTPQANVQTAAVAEEQPLALAAGAERQTVQVAGQTGQPRIVASAGDKGGPKVVGSPPTVTRTNVGGGAGSGRTTGGPSTSNVRTIRPTKSGAETTGAPKRPAFENDPQLQQGLRQIQDEAAAKGTGEIVPDFQEGNIGIGLRDKPGGAPVPVQFERGNFVHNNAELFLPPNRLPRGLEPEVSIAGGRIRIDRVDWRTGTAYEIRPNTPTQIADMQRQMPNRLRALDAEYPLGGGRTWQGQIVPYEAEDAIQFLMGQGASRPQAQAILELYGFRF